MELKVFFSYAHEDEPLLKKLKQHLASLRNQGLIQSWHDRDISPGVEWEPEIVAHLDTADIILLLVSVEFIASEYCYGKELQRAIIRHERRQARVIPIILRPVDWQIHPLDKLQALPTNVRPVTGAGWHSVDEAWLDVVRGIRSAINDLQKRPRPNSPYQQQGNYIYNQMQQGIPAIAALHQCDPELGKLFDWVISMSNQVQRNTQDQNDTMFSRAQVEKLLTEVSAAGDGNLRVQAEVTPDTLGIVADSFNGSFQNLGVA